MRASVRMRTLLLFVYLRKCLRRELKEILWGEPFEKEKDLPNWMRGDFGGNWGLITGWKWRVRLIALAKTLFGLCGQRFLGVLFSKKEEKKRRLLLFCA